MRRTLTNKITVLFTLIAVSAISNSTFAENVEVVLKDKLDGNLSGYCLDIVGGGNNINPADGLQAHTCYSYRGDLGSDQAIDSKQISEQGVFNLTEFEVCMTLAATDPGSKLGLEECNESPQQQFVFSGNGQISPKDSPELCLTAGEETRFGRNGTSPHQIKDLTVEACSEDLAKFQQWRTRSEAD